MRRPVGLKGQTYAATHASNVVAERKAYLTTHFENRPIPTPPQALLLRSAVKYSCWIMSSLRSHSFFLTASFSFMKQNYPLFLHWDYLYFHVKDQRHFGGLELQGVAPDIVILGKPIGNGHPLGAVVTTRKIADAFANGMEYLNTFGGNAVSCVIGREVLAVVEEEQSSQNAALVGNHLLKGLKKMQEQFLVIGDVRGHGFFWGFELVKHRKEKIPAPDYRPGWNLVPRWRTMIDPRSDARPRKP